MCRLGSVVSHQQMIAVQGSVLCWRKNTKRALISVLLLYILLTPGILAGAVDVMADNADADFSQAHVFMKLVPTITAALQAYQTRAAQCGHSFKHTVRLEAAVQGWCVPALLFIRSSLPQLKHTSRGASTQKQSTSLLSGPCLADFPNTDLNT